MKWRLHGMGIGFSDMYHIRYEGVVWITIYLLFPHVWMLLLDTFDVI